MAPGPKIVIVENEGIISLSLKRRLENLGYTVPAVAATGREAIEKAEQHHPDLMLVDIMLNDEMDGIEAMNRIQSRWEIPVVYLTAYADEEILERAKGTKPFGYIVKPFQERELAATIKMALHLSGTMKGRLGPPIQRRALRRGAADQTLPGKINLSKISPPHLSQMVIRPRLFNLFEKGKDKKIILVTGQAAQGKTTLVASYTAISETPSCWVSLDRKESDPVTLMNLITHSFRHSFKDIAFTESISFFVKTRRIRPTISFYREWIRSFFKNLSFPIHLVIDNLNVLSPDALAWKFLQILIDEAPPHIQLIMLSRDMPLLMIEGLKIKSQILILGNEHLTFTKEEAKEFFLKRELSLNPDPFEMIYKSTEGWIGGLVLCAESLLQSPALLADGDFLGIYTSEIRNHYFEFLDKEVFSKQTQKLQQFMIQSSIFDPIVSHDLKVCLGIKNADILLQELFKKNLFIQRFARGEEEPIYRYHDLFRLFLRNKFEFQISDQEGKTLLLKVALFYEQKGDWESALEYYLRAKHDIQAINVMEQLGLVLLETGKDENLKEWLYRFPKNKIQKNPWFLLFEVACKKVNLGIKEVETLWKVTIQFRKNKDKKGEMVSLSQLLWAMLLTGMNITSIEKLIKEGEALLESFKFEEFIYGRLSLTIAIGLGHIMVKGDIRKGIFTFENAYVLSKKINEPNISIEVLSYLLFGLMKAGDYISAEEILRKIEKMIGKNGDKIISESRVIYLQMGGTLAKYKADGVGLGRFSQALKQEIVENGFDSLYPWFYELSGHLHLLQGDFKMALETGKQCLNSSIRLKNILLTGLAYRFLGMVHLHQGEFKKAYERVEQSMRIFSKEFPSRFELYRTKVIMGLICIYLKKYKKAEEELHEAIQYFSFIMNFVVIAEIHFIRALLNWDQGAGEEAMFQLKSGFNIAEKRRYDYFYGLGAKYTKEVCLLAIKLKVSEAMNYVGDLLSTSLSSEAEADLHKLSTHSDPMIRGNVLEIRKKIFLSKVPRLRMETLGEFKVFRDGSPVKESEWVRIQPKNLLKSILSNKNHKTPVDQIIDDLWPEEETEKGEKIFKITLHRLRKILEPGLSKEYGSSYIELKDNLLSLNMEVCEVDVVEFLSLIDKGKEREKRGDIKGAILFYAEASEHYKGDFISENLNSLKIDSRREELKGRYVELLSKSADLSEKQGALKKSITYYKNVLEINPLLEETYQKLMLLYFNIGMRNEAIRLYETYLNICKEYPSWTPDPVIMNLYNKFLVENTPT